MRDKPDLLVYLAPEAAHEHVALLVNGVYMSSDADGYPAVQARLAALIESARDEYLLAAAQYHIRYDLLEVRPFLRLGARHELVLISDYIKKLIGAVGDKSVASRYEALYLFALYDQYLFHHSSHFAALSTARSHL